MLCISLRSKTTRIYQTAKATETIDTGVHKTWPRAASVVCGRSSHGEARGDPPGTARAGRPTTGFTNHQQGRAGDQRKPGLHTSPDDRESEGYVGLGQCNVVNPRRDPYLQQRTPDEDDSGAHSQRQGLTGQRQTSLVFVWPPSGH